MSLVSTPPPAWVVEQVARLDGYGDAWDVPWSLETLAMDRGTRLIFRGPAGEVLTVRVVRCGCCRAIVWDCAIEETGS